MLTQCQQELLHYMEEAFAATNRAPSLRQAAEDLGISHTAVAQRLHALEKKGYIKRDGRYSRAVYLLNKRGNANAIHHLREVPVIGRVQAGLPMYAQQEWEDSVILDNRLFGGDNLFGLRVRGSSMRDAGILANDLVICEPRQYAENGEIVVALVHDEEATVKRFFFHGDSIELRPENETFSPIFYTLSEVLIQGKVVGVIRNGVEREG